jgi:hypothetical protein
MYTPATCRPQACSGPAVRAGADPWCGGLTAKLDFADGLKDAQLDGGARVHTVHGDVARGVLRK